MGAFARERESPSSHLYAPRAVFEPIWCKNGTKGAGKGPFGRVF
ncbi:hypothetical protein HMPREF0262_01293 [Clostridium sp. ATCC 29733]|nr:hypothetical protein HMPREF0262_01293 [Clostridium sp. ATCC 29733]